MSTKTDLLAVTAKLFAELGWRGTTTRRIADAAGVNEVTVFRHFGSKEALVSEAILHASNETAPPRLPLEPGDVHAELLSWALRHYAQIVGKRSMILTCLAEFEEHPELAPVACEAPLLALQDVVRYLTRARELKLIGPEGSIDAAAVMLMNALFMDSVTRDIVAEWQAIPANTAVGMFVDLTLRALACREDV
jgi:AcrR family transcriptional regulator